MSAGNVGTRRSLTLTLDVTVKSESKPEEVARVLARVLQVAWETPNIVRGIAEEVGVLGVGEFRRQDATCQFEGCALCGAKCHTCGKPREQHNGEKA